jgi:hypothetical protein
LEKREMAWAIKGRGQQPPLLQESGTLLIRECKVFLMLPPVRTIADGEKETISPRLPSPEEYPMKK